MRYFTVSLAIAVASAFFMAACSRNNDASGEDVYVGKPIYSPDHKHIAVLFTESGGGGISPYCITRVSVAAASVEPSIAYAEKYLVYQGGCHSLGFVEIEGKRILQDAPALKWDGSSVLSISFNPRLAAGYVRKVILATHSYDGAVSVVSVP
ncbi:hypothetical protein [Rugamonas aquatica]|uniref:Lipoprotein n=1 Tax=Rugamonas aquatica TaxID=2743357 RepID=A0A6A7N1H1_9BURK|nr:hypothetical protein [Rugamonas aquatica]MQA38899.1 hypothetical protein [Rugamonas aquatica]